MSIFSSPTRVQHTAIPSYPQLLLIKAYNKPVLLTLPPHPPDSRASQSSPSSPHPAPPPSNTSRPHNRDSPTTQHKIPHRARLQKLPPLKPQPIPLLRHHDVQNRQVERRPTRRNQRIQHGAKVEQDSVPVIAGADGAAVRTRAAAQQQTQMVAAPGVGEARGRALKRW